MNILKCVIIFFNFHKHFNEIKTYFVLHPHFDSVCYSNKNKNIQREGISTISEDFFYNCLCYLYYILHWVCINIFFYLQCFQYPNYFRVVLTVPTEKVTEACQRIRTFCERHFQPGVNVLNKYDYTFKRIMHGSRINGCSDIFEVEKWFCKLYHQIIYFWSDIVNWFWQSCLHKCSVKLSFLPWYVTCVFSNRLQLKTHQLNTIDCVKTYSITLLHWKKWVNAT